MKFGTITKTLIILWVAELAMISVLWNFLPNRSTSVVLLGLVAVNAVMFFRRQLELPIFTNVALLLAVTHFWLGNGFISPLIGSALIFIGVSLTGLAVKSINNTIDREDILVWLLVGLFTAQIATLTQFWPVTYFQKSMLGTVTFYLVWQLWTVIDSGRRPILSHFVFVVAAVIVIVASIIWTTWPGLKPL